MGFLCCKDKKVDIIEDVDKVYKQCLLCLEDNASKRKCCNATYCDHCYTKDKACPNCGTSTRQEKQTGATYVLQSYSEHEECRACLEPGMRRKCCGNYYCDDCYYKLPRCRVCDSLIGKKGLMTGAMKAHIISIILGWFFTLFMTGVVVACTATILAAEELTPVGIYGYGCHGFFRDCDIMFCIESTPRIANGDDPLPSHDTYKHCTLDTEYKMEGWGCVYDPQLYRVTQQTMGFDICRKNFDEGIYIFEDTFEAWDTFKLESNQMKSAFWQNITNGYATTYCGSGEHFGGKKALTFSGAYQRDAVTIPLDVKSGGWIEAEIFIAPFGFDIKNPDCKSSFSGVVYVKYSIDYGLTWITIGFYDSWKYRSEKFFKIKLELPDLAKTNHTQFQFVQSAFDSVRDAWGLDNVKVFRYLPKNWVEQKEPNQKKTLSNIQKIQCCYDTDWCETRLSPDEILEQCTSLSFYYNRSFEVRLSEMLIILIFIINICKFTYVSIQQYLMFDLFPFEDEYRDLANIDRLMNLLPPRYRPKKSLEDFASNIHLSARLVGNMKDAFKDEEGEGDRVLRPEEEEAIRKAEKKRLKDLKKLLKERQKNARYAGGILEEGLNTTLEEKEVEVVENTNNGMTVPSDKIADKMDKFKRQNVSLLRTPFDLLVSMEWRILFSSTLISVFSIVFFWKVTTTYYYILEQPVTPFGLWEGTIYLTSIGINMIAFICDFKEIYHTLKYIVPIRDKWVPYVTVDLSEELNSVYVGPHIVCLDDVYDASIFQPHVTVLYSLCYWIASFPWCLFSLVVRDHYLDHANMRFVTPAFGAIAVLRAFLGPSFIVKSFHGIQFYFAIDPHVRESIGYAIQQERTKTSATNTALGFSLTGAFLTSCVKAEYTAYVFGGCIVLGLLYGFVTGCAHSLPIRPWMCITTIRGGVWFKVKKKQECPCLYRGKYCTDMHQAIEVFIVYPKDEWKFMKLLKGGTSAVTDE